MHYTSAESTASANADENSALAYAPIHTVAERLRTGALSASALVECYLQRIRRHDHARQNPYGGVRVRRMGHEFDALLLPATPLPPVPLAEIDQGKSSMSLLTRPVNLLDLCALALPCGFTVGGLPISLQIAGRGYDEARVLRIGWAYENATDRHGRRPPPL